MEKCRPYLYVKQSCRNFMQVNDNPPFNVPEYVPRPTAIMSFPDAVKKVLMQNYANFNGRASRSEYWWFCLFAAFLYIPAIMIDNLSGLVIIESIPDSGIGLGPLYLLYVLGMLLPILSLSVRRLHDIGRSGWWYLIIFVPCFGFIVFFVFIVMDGQPHHNDYGEVPTNIL